MEAYRVPWTVPELQLDDILHPSIFAETNQLANQSPARIDVDFLNVDSYPPPTNTCPPTTVNHCLLPLVINIPEENHVTAAKYRPHDPCPNCKMIYSPLWRTLDNSRGGPTYCNACALYYQAVGDYAVELSDLTDNM